MTSFRSRRRKSGRAVIVDFAEHEAEILAGMLRNLIELLYDGMPPRATSAGDPLDDLIATDGPTAPPEDEVLRRLLPDAYASDDEAASEFRRFTERGLRDGKAGDAKLVLTVLEDKDTVAEGIEIEPADQLPWLRAINDLRLALGTRLGVSEDDSEFWENLTEDDPRRITYDLYDWLGYLQSALLHNLR